jgi:hypothetical protein
LYFQHNAGISLQKQPRIQLQGIFKGAFTVSRTPSLPKHPGPEKTALIFVHLLRPIYAKFAQRAKDAHAPTLDKPLRNTVA